METDSDNAQNLESAQEAFKKLREQDRAEMLKKMQQIEDAQVLAKTIIDKKQRKKSNVADNAKRPRKKKKKSRKATDNEVSQRIVTSGGKTEIRQVKNKDEQPISDIPPTKTPTTTTIETTEADRTNDHTMNMEQRQRRRRGGCTNCCRGLPGKGPGSPHDGCSTRCGCTSGKSEQRLRGGNDVDRSIDGNSAMFDRVRSSSEDSRILRGSRGRCCGRSPMMGIFANDCCEARSFGGYDPRTDSLSINEGRARGGCGTCGVQRPSSSCCRPCTPPPACQKQREIPCSETSRGCPKGPGGCPCGGCGGPACSDNPGGGGIGGGCCGGNRPQGLPCKCKCQSCDTFRPLGGCGGQSCGRMYSCASSGGGRCCFPRNHKRRSGPECCGGADPNCGGCC